CGCLFRCGRRIALVVCSRVLCCLLFINRACLAECFFGDSEFRRAFVVESQKEKLIGERLMCRRRILIGLAFSNDVLSADVETLRCWDAVVSRKRSVSAARDVK